MQTALSQIWTWFAVSISFETNYILNAFETINIKIKIFENRLKKFFLSKN